MAGGGRWGIIFHASMLIYKFGGWPRSSRSSHATYEIHPVVSHPPRVQVWARGPSAVPKLYCSVTRLVLEGLLLSDLMSGETDLRSLVPLALPSWFPQ